MPMLARACARPAALGWPWKRARDATCAGLIAARRPAGLEGGAEGPAPTPSRLDGGPCAGRLAANARILFAFGLFAVFIADPALVTPRARDPGGRHRLRLAQSRRRRCARLARQACRVRFHLRAKSFAVEGFLRAGRFAAPLPSMTNACCGRASFHPCADSASTNTPFTTFRLHRDRVPAPPPACCSRSAPRPRRRAATPGEAGSHCRRSRPSRSLFIHGARRAPPALMDRRCGSLRANKAPPPPCSARPPTTT